MSLISRLLKANPSAQVSDMLTGYFVIPSAKSAFNDFSNRALFGGGTSPGGFVNVIDYINISTTGNATDFGDLTLARDQRNGFSSSTRGIFFGGYNNVNGGIDDENVIDYVTIATAGNAIDFGDMATAQYHTAGLANETRGVTGGAYRHATGSTRDEIEYITIASTGNTTSFGTLTAARYGGAGSASSTRGLFNMGAASGGGQQSNIDYITIATTGNATSFGNRTIASPYHMASSSSTRSLCYGGAASGGTVNVIDYVTIATTGNATDFGDLTAIRNSGGATASALRGVVGGGNKAGVRSTTIEYVTIATTGNATDFGDLTIARNDDGACSNSHGGL
jgi:hypothetical protein